MSLIVQPYLWIASDDNNEKLVLKAWCHVKDTSERALVRIYDYKVPLLIKFRRMSNGNKMTRKNIHDWYEALCKYLSSREPHAPYKYSFKELTPFINYRSSKSEFIELRFTSLNAVRHCANFLKKYPVRIKGKFDRLVEVNVEVYEDHIPVQNKFLTENNQRYCQWFSISTDLLSNPKISKLEHEYTCKKKEINLLCPEETENYIANPTIASFDIETYSDVDNAMPKAENFEHVCYMISVVIRRIGTPLSETKKYLLTTVPCSKDDDYIVETFEDAEENAEVAMIKRMVDIFNEADPTFITGHNIGGFDFPYIDRRLYNFTEGGEWPSLSLLKKEKTFLKRDSWESSAHFVDSMLLCNEGRFCLDMLTYVKMQQYKLPNYKLDTIAQHFMNVGKDPITHTDIFKAYKCGDPNQVGVVGKYCVKDSFLIAQLIEKLNIWSFLVEVANNATVSVADVYLRGEQPKILGAIYPLAKQNGFAVKSRGAPPDVGGYKGAYVVQPLAGLYEHIATFDFNSMYPNIIIDFNICFTTLVNKNTKIDEEKVNIFEWTETDEKTGEVTVHKHRFIKREFYIGILPKICKNFLTMRKNIRKQISPDNQEVINMILDAKQKALKVLANTVYGALGYAKQSGKITLLEGAETICYIGRKLIKESGKIVEDELNGKVVYGDTDSIMVDIGLGDPDKRKELCDFYKIEEDENLYTTNYNICKQVGKMISDRLPEHMILDLECISMRALYMRKKRYCYWKYDKNGKLDDKLSMKGIELVRRDNCGLLQEMYKTILDMVIREKPDFNKVYTYVDTIIGRLKADLIPYDKLALSASIGKVYDKKSTYSLAVFKRRMKKEYDKDMKVGERFRYIIVKTNSPKISEKMILYDDIYLTLEDRPDICKETYIKKKLGASIDKLLFTIFYRDNPDEEFEKKCECGKDSESIVFPCRHKFSCLECIENYTNCLVCTKKIKKYIEDDICIGFNERREKYAYIRNMI